MKHAHHEKMLELDAEYQQVLLTYFNLLKADSAFSGKDSLENKLGAIQVEKANVTFNHFKELKGICTPSQKVGFDSILPQIMRVISPGHPGDGPPAPRD
jgi:protein CpxP